VSAELRVLEFLLYKRRTLIGEVASLLGYSESLVIEVVNNYSDLVKLVNEEVIVVKPIELAIALSERGVELKRISEHLDWRDFEAFTSRILEESGYSVHRGVKLTTPVRFEIDVIGVDPVSGIGLIVDCKHWSIASRSRLVEAAERHYERTCKLVKYYSRVKQLYRALEKATRLLPLVITLTTPSIRVHSKVLFASIRELPALLREIYVVIDHYEVEPITLPRI
jgi:hypothetical protein